MLVQASLEQPAAVIADARSAQARLFIGATALSMTRSAE
jgi:hypothetical protein